MNSVKIVYQGGIGEITEKKSRFIAEIIPISSEEDALTFIENKKKKHWDASHNCSAYVLGMNNEIERSSDDGEPSRTAGKPMLDVLLMEGIHNAAVVVTRYFGGTLLGTGGLIRAYQAAVKEGLNNSVIVEKISARIYQVSTDYNGIGKLIHIAENMGLKIINTIYTEVVEAEILLTLEKEGEFIKRFQEAVSGKAVIIKKKDVYYAELHNDIILL